MSLGEGCKDFIVLIFQIFHKFEIILKYRMNDRSGFQKPAYERELENEVVTAGQEETREAFSRIGITRASS